jgi:hypothetical protein
MRAHHIWTLKWQSWLLPYLQIASAQLDARTTITRRSASIRKLQRALMTTVLDGAGYWWTFVS